MVYEYGCEACEKVTEISKPVADMDRDEKCETCQSVMKRLISRSSFQLKGGGWAKDGYYKPYITFKSKSGDTTVPYDDKKVKKGKDD